jgi:hypothetical protein
LTELTCGECRFFRPTESRPDYDIGRCKLEKLMGVFRENTKTCSSFSRPGDTHLPSPSASRRTSGSRPTADPIRFNVSSGALAELLGTLSPLELKQALEKQFNLRAVVPVEPLPTRIEGDVLLIPADTGLKSKDIPFDQFANKAFMLRDNLRVLEQKVNSSDRFGLSLKLEVQARLSRCQAAILNFTVGWHRSSGPPEDAEVLLTELARDVAWNGAILTPPQMGDRWRGGQVAYADTGIAEPIEHFFHRMVIMRDRLLSLEATIDAMLQLSKEDRSSLTTYLRRCHGSLTTFNILFRDREDYFSSSR